MAKKTPAYLQYAELHHQRYLNAQSEIEAMLEQDEEENGIVLPEEVKRDIIRQYVRTGRKDFSVGTDITGETPALPEEEADVPVLPEEAAAPEPEPEGYWSERMGELRQAGREVGQLVDTVQGGLLRSAAGGMEQVERLPSGSPAQAATGGLARFVSALSSFAEGDAQGLADAVFKPLSEVKSEFTSSLRDDAKEGLATGQSLRESLADRDPVTQWIGEGIVDAASSPTGALSLIGGPAGAVAIGDAYAQAYEQGLSNGLQGEELEAWAWSQAAPEALSIIPAGQVLERIPVLGNVLKKKAAEVATRFARTATVGGRSASLTARTAAGEALEEGATGALQDLAAIGFANQEVSEDLQALGMQEAPKSLAEFASNVHDNMRAGLAFAGATAPSNINRAATEIAAEQGARAEQVLNKVTQTRAGAMQQRPTSIQEMREPEQGDMFPATEELPTVEQFEAERQRQLEEDAAWRVREQQAEQADTIAARQANREDLLRSMERRVDTARGNVEALQERVDAGDTSQGTLNSLTAAISEQRSAEDTYARQLERVELGRQEAVARETTPAPAVEQPAPTQLELPVDNPTQSYVARRREAVAKKAQEQQKKDQKKARDTETTRRREVTDRLLTENPNLTDEQLAPLVDAEMARPAPAAEATPAPARGRRTTTPAPTPEPREEAAPEDDEVRRAIQAAGIKVKERNPALDMAARTPAQERDFDTASRAIVEGLVKANTQPSVDVLNLLNEGRIALLKNPTEAGMQDRNQAGTYDPNTGQMYVFTDRVDPNKPVEAMLEAALHESAHAGQGTTRQGRDSAMRLLLGEDGYKAINDRILRAAENGNAAAIAARDKAAATGAQELEVVSYFAGEAARRRASAGSLGRLRSTANDIVAGARRVLREKFGADWDISLGEIEAASQRVAGEALETGATTRPGSPLDMVYNKESRGFEEAVRNGWVYESVDGRQKYVLSDKDAKIKPAGLDKLQRTGQANLFELLEHDVLYREHPGAASIPVFSAERLLSDNNFAFYDSGSNEIWTRKDLVAGTNREGPGLREALMHELQHYVQAQGGYADEFYQGAPEEAAAALRAREMDYAAANEDFQTLSDMFVEEMSSVTPRGANRRAIMEAAMEPARDSVARALNVQAVVEGFETITPEQQGLLDQFEEGRASFNQAVVALNAERDREMARYARNITEREAFFTQYNVDEAGVQGITDAEQIMRTQETDPETGRDPTGGAIDVPIGGTTVAAMGQQRDMAAEAQPEPQVPAEQLGPRETFRRIIDHGVRGRTADMKQAEALDSRYHEAFAADVKGDVAQANEDIMSALTEMETLPAPERAAKWEAFKEQYPNLAPVVQEMRERIDRNTMEYIQSLANTGRELTPDQRKTVMTLLANRGKYLTRAYAAFQGPAGREWAENRWSVAKKNMAKYLQDPALVKNKTARDHTKAIVDALAVMENQLQIPNNDTLVRMRTDKLERLYASHLGNAALPIRDRDSETDLEDYKAALVNGLARRRDTIGPDIYKSMADNALKELLGLAPRQNAIVRNLTSIARNPGTLKEREFMPEELRTALGEIKDPAGQVLATLATQAQLLSRLNTQAELIEKHVGTLVLPPSRIDEAGMRERFPHVLEGEQYGPLNGYYVTPNVYNNLREEIAVYHTFREALSMFANANTVENIKPLLGKLWDAGTSRGLGRLNRAHKLATVIGSPINWAGNLAGSWLTLLRAGNLLSGSARGMATARDYIGATMYDSTTDRLDAAFRYVNLEAVDVGEIQRVLGDKLQTYFDGKADDSFIMQELTKDKQNLRTVIAGYAMADAWAKMANFWQRADMLTAYYKAAGVERTPEEVMREAGDVTSYTNISQERVLPLFRYTEQRGLSQFLPYFSEVMRTTWTNYAQAARDLARANETANPEARAIMRNAATARFLGNTAASLAVPAVLPMKVNAITQALGLGAAFALAQGDDEDQELMRRMVGEFNRFQDLVYFGRDKDDNAIMYGVSQRLDPQGPFTDLVRALTMNEDPGEALRQAGKVLSELYIAPPYLMRWYRAATQDSPPESRINRMDPETMAAMREAGELMNLSPADINRIAYAMDTFLPGFTRGQDPEFAPQLSDERKKTTEGLVVESMRSLGASFEVVKPQRALIGYAIASGNKQSEARAELNDNLAYADNLTPELVQQELDKYVIAMHERFVEDQKNVASLRLWGYTDPEIVGLLANAGWSKRDAKALVNGEPALVVSKQSLESGMSRKSGTMQSSKDFYAQRYEDSLKLIEQVKDQYDDVGLEVER
jgi:hypothetical protein